MYKIAKMGALGATLAIAVMLVPSIEARVVKSGSEPAVQAEIVSRYPIVDKAISKGGISIVVRRDKLGNCAILQEDPIAGTLETEHLGPGESVTGYIIPVTCPSP